MLVYVNLSSKLNVTVQPVFVSRPKLEQQLKRHEIKPPIVNQQCIVYEFKCNLCDAGYVGYTRGHLHERVEGHLESHLQFTNITTSNTIVKCLNASSSNFTSSRNVAANLIASLKKCCTFAHAKTNTERANGFHPRQGVCLDRLL